MASSQNQEFFPMDLKLPKQILDMKLDATENKKIQFIKQILVWGSSHEFDLKN